MPMAKKPESLEQTERAELDRLRAALSAAGDVVYEWNLETGAMAWSDNALSILGLPETADISTHARFVERVNSEDAPNLERAHRDHLTQPTPFQLEYRLRRNGGEFCWVHDSGVTRFSDEGKAESVVGVIRVVTSHKQKEAHLEWLTTYDDLTGHFNRGRLRDALNHALAYAERYDAPGAYLAVQLNDLPLISDAYGHDTADTVLVAIGQALDQCLRASDIVGRIAPDQFGIIASACAEKDIEQTAEKIITAVQQATVRCSVGPIHLSVSIGGVTFPGTVRTSHEAMSKADVALEHARKSGANHFIAYNLSEEQRLGRRRNLVIAKQIQTALQTDGLALAFQPVVESATQEVSFYECLLRMREGADRFVNASAFMRIAEEMGLVRLIDRRVLDMVVKELKSSPDVTLAMNISGLTTTDPAWLRSLFAQVKGCPEVAERLIIEITETAALHDIEETIRFVSAVREVGCRVALDDFGAGYTSFRHLKALAVDVVKIDGSFITNLIDQPQDFLFVKTLQDLAEGFSLKTVAECVETREVAEMLAREGVHYLQGYYFGRPSFDRPWRERTLLGRLTKLAVGHS